MASKSKEQSSSVASGGAVVALLIAAGAYLIHKDAPLEGIRPSAQEAVFHGYAYHDIDARLWQDPFGAVEKQLEGETPHSACRTSDKRAQTNRPKGTTAKATAPPPSGVRASRFEHDEHVKLELQSRSHDSTLILPVMVSGAPYPEDVEFRRRLRYAVVSALARKRFQPADAQHIDYYRVCIPGLDDKPINTVVPYEWFDREGSSEGSGNLQSILILWINEQYLTDTIAKDKTPVKILQELTSPRFGSAMSGKEVSASTASVPIIGPHTSDGLLAIGKERRASKFRYFSYGATIAPEEVKKRLPDESKLGSLPTGWTEIERTIATDDALADRLVNELKLRDVSYANGHSIALVSEWDTTYGQAIMESVRCAYRKSEPCPSTEPPPSKKPRIILKSYLRGIDGVTASDDKKPEDRRAGRSADKKADDAEEAFDKKAARAGDRPHGPSQRDYLRRLTDRLVEDDEQIRLKGGAGIKAIGVLGSDVFDKLLVLRALKPNFPNAIFFTTDYDAALIMQSELDWTRNLIVASSFGSTLGDKLQGDIPPFRSAYQTSAFLATQLAIDDRAGIARAQDIEKELRRPQLFEITRTGAFLALRQPVKEKDDLPSPTQVQREPLHAFPELPTPERLFVASALAVGGSALLAMAYAQRRKSALIRESNGIRHAAGGAWKDALIIGLSLLFAAIVAGAWEQVALFLTKDGAGEPIKLSDGVSVWPTIAIRLLAIILCWLIVARASRRLDDNLDEIAEKLRLACPAKVIERASRRGKLAFNFTRDFRPWLDILTPKIATFDRSASESKPYKIRSGWFKYVCAGRKTARHLRTAFVSSLLFLMFCIVWGVYGNIVPPIRGDFARTLFEATLPIEFLFIAYAIMYVTDATILCLCFVNDLEHHPTIWPTVCETRCAESAASDTSQSDIDIVRNDELDLSFIEMRTACILPLAYWPFLLVALTIVERSRIFADYPDSGAILFFTALALVIIVGCAFALNRAVEFARASSKRKIEDALLDDKAVKSLHSNLEQKSSDGQGDAAKAHGDPKRLSDADRDYLEALLEKITNLDGGAFSPIWRQPLLKGLVLPIAGFASNLLFAGNWFSRF